VLRVAPPPPPQMKIEWVYPAKDDASEVEAGGISYRYFRITGKKPDEAEWKPVTGIKLLTNPRNSEGTASNADGIAVVGVQTDSISTSENQTKTVTIYGAAFGAQTVTDRFVECESIVTGKFFYPLTIKPRTSVWEFEMSASAKNILSCGAKLSGESHYRNNDDKPSLIEAEAILSFGNGGRLDLDQSAGMLIAGEVGMSVGSSAKLKLGCGTRQRDVDKPDNLQQQALRQCWFGLNILAPLHPLLMDFKNKIANDPDKMKLITEALKSADDFWMLGGLSIESSVSFSGSLGLGLATPGVGGIGVKCGVEGEISGEMS